VSLFAAAFGFGLVSMSVIALAAVGFTMQFGITNMINLAYGQVMISSAYVAYYINRAGVSIWIGMIAGAAFGAIFSFLLNRIVYAPFQRNHERLLVMDVRSAELTKYAANAMLATRISFMNELANLADELGADIEHVRQGIGADPRIGYHFLYPGAGYGGSCFPKDVKALQFTAQQHGRPLTILAAVAEANEAQKLRLIEKITNRLGSDLAGRKIALWGLAFKPNTDDMREAPSQTIVSGLVGCGATVVAYDPVAMDEAKRVFGPMPGLSYAESPLDAVAGADALVVVTEWKEFRSPDFGELKERLKAPLLFDGRNLYDPALARAAGLEYFGIGRP